MNWHSGIRKAARRIAALTLVSTLLSSAAAQVNDISEGSSIDFDRQYDRIQCGNSAHSSRFKEATDEIIADPVVIRATVVRTLSKEEVSNLQVVTNHSEATNWVIVSVDEVVKGQVTVPTLLANVGCLNAERIGRTGFLSGTVITRPPSHESSQLPPEFAYPPPKYWTGMPIGDYAPHSTDLPLIPIPPGEAHEMVTLPGEMPGPRSVRALVCKKDHTVSVFKRAHNQSAPIIFKGTVTGLTDLERGLRPKPQLSSGTYAFVRVEKIVSGSLPYDAVLLIEPPFSQHTVCVPEFTLGENGTISGHLKPRSPDLPAAEPGSYESRYLVLETEVKE